MRIFGRRVVIASWKCLLAVFLTSVLCHAGLENQNRKSNGVAFGEHASSQDRTQEIEPPDVFVRIALLRSELELIRYEMGKPQNHQPEIEVTNAAPREVFFQALTLFRKADRLCFEQIRERVPLPETSTGEIRPPHVFAVVDAALGRVRRVKAKLGIGEQSQEMPRDATKTPTHVFRAIVQANRQLNLLLDQQFAPSDVYQQVTLAISYGSRLRARFPEATPIPEAPPFEGGKRPADVYRRLVGCFEQTRRIAEHSRLKVLELKVGGEHLEEVTPSDVYDLASLLVSELAYLHSKLQDAKPPHETYYPGRKFPSHVYQRVGILDALLLELLRWADEAPNWLHQEVRKR